MQQLFVVNIEERRKDHWQMFTHHIFTSMLLVCSYAFYQTKVGNVILCMMDFCDILLAVSATAIEKTVKANSGRAVCKDAKLSELFDRLRLRIRPLHLELVHHTPHLLQHGLLFDLRTRTLYSRLSVRLL